MVGDQRLLVTGTLGCLILRPVVPIMPWLAQLSDAWLAAEPSVRP